MKPRILVAYDFSPASARALAWAADLQRTAGGLPVHAVHVVNPVPAVSAPEMMVPALTETDVSEIARALERAVQEIDAAVTSAVILAAAPGAAIVDAAKRLEADLIVMGTHGRGGFSRLVLGSVAEYVVRHAACPVVTVRSAPAEAARAA